MPGDAGTGPQADRQKVEQEGKEAEPQRLPAAGSGDQAGEAGDQADHGERKEQQNRRVTPVGQ